MKISLATLLAKLPLPATGKWPQGVWDITAWKQGSMSLELFAPKNHDCQTPHSQDEMYVIVRGSGTFVLENQQIDFAPGDVLIVPAGKVHRFSNFTPDLITWVIFWAPERVAPARIAQPATRR
jgi:mannose-6-phosphate isomerase-like protein (cupin superfamily)